MRRAAAALYRVLNTGGDSVAVPRLIFTKLCAPCKDDVRFRVALYVIASGETDARQVASELHIKPAEAEQALQFWEGAGLVEKLAEATEVALAPAVRKRLTTREVTAAGDADPVLGGMIAELQRIFGGIVSQSDINIFVTLYNVDGLPADLILLAASYFASKGKTSARYIEKTLLSWRMEGITDSASADRYLQQLALREAREREIALLMGMQTPAFTLAERKHIAKWYEEYGYSREMIETARMYAGEKQNEVRYISGILKKWYAKGWMTPKDVQQADANRNLRVTSERRIAPEDDILMQDAYIAQGSVGE